MEASMKCLLNYVQDDAFIYTHVQSNKKMLKKVRHKQTRSKVRRCAVRVCVCERVCDAVYQCTVHQPSPPGLT